MAIERRFLPMDLIPHHKKTPFMRGSTPSAKPSPSVGNRLARFLAVGATGTMVDVTAFVILLVALHPEFARAVAIWLGMNWNFFWNRAFTFTGAGGKVGWQYVGFCTSCLAGAIINWYVSLWLFHARPLGLDMTIPAPIAGGAAGALVNFSLCCAVVFRVPWIPQRRFKAIETK